MIKYANAAKITDMAKALFKEERAINRLDGWFLARETVCNKSAEFDGLSKELRAARELEAIIAEIPLWISDNAIFAGTQRDAFARSYALINPSFRVATFNGYCDPTAVFGDIEPNEEFTAERINRVCEYMKTTPYIKKLSKTYSECEDYTGEVVYFVEQVTGHLIPNFRPALKYGVKKMIADVDAKIAASEGEIKENLVAFRIALGCVLTLAERYAVIAEAKAAEKTGAEKEQFELMAKTLRRVPAEGATGLYEAIQSFILLWQVMCLEQAPNPFAFSVGNADRVFEPYREADGLSREDAAALLKHLLVFYNVADRSWAISQNLIVGGKSSDGVDLTSETSYALLDAYYDMNLPQPILSVKLHKNTPEKLYRELGRFFFSPGVLTPSLFNDDAMFEVLSSCGVRHADLENYSIAGCQEPLICGKDNANTTNSWLNLGKVLELTISDGVSTITGDRIWDATGRDAAFILSNLRSIFYENLDRVIDRMAESANGASVALSELRVPFLSCFMGGIEHGYDTRDDKHQGTDYNGSGCLIHGLTVLADSFVAVDCLMRERPEDADRLVEALRTNFANDPELREYLRACPKFGNNNATVDAEAAEIASRVSEMVRARKNYLGNPFRADWSSPTTHLTYGYWVGALPNGRASRDQLNYGVDPLYGSAENGMGFRLLSNMKLPFGEMNGGYASHLGIDPKYFTAESFEEKGLQFRDRVTNPLFFNPAIKGVAPFYLYVNVTTPETLRKVLANPKKYAPSGVYIMRIHGTFVNFLDLSPEIQEDIITRLDPASTCGC